MIVVIDADAQTTHQNAKALVSEQSALLNTLHGLGYKAFNPPLAAVLKRFHELEGEWAIVSPVHWEASHNDVVIVAAGKDLQLDDATSKEYFTLLANYLAEDGTELYYHAADIWLLRVDNKPAFQAKPVHALINQSLMQHLSALDDSMYWQKFNTECQMLFATKSGDVNGVWVWGTGALTQTNLTICADNSLFGLASCMGANTIVYTHELALANSDLLVVKDLSSISTSHQQELQQSGATWYWNNLAYSQSPTNWLQRLWRTIIHAN